MLPFVQFFYGKIRRTMVFDDIRNRRIQEEAARADERKKLENEAKQRAEEQLNADRDVHYRILNLCRNYNNGSGSVDDILDELIDAKWGKNGGKSDKDASFIAHYKTKHGDRELMRRRTMSLEEFQGMSGFDVKENRKRLEKLIDLFVTALLKRDGRTGSLIERIKGECPKWIGSKASEIFLEQVTLRLAMDTVYHDDWETQHRTTSYVGIVVTIDNNGLMLNGRPLQNDEKSFIDALKEIVSNESYVSI
jgi:hypothetical protein